MKTMCEAVRDRIQFLMKEKNLNQNQLELNSGVFHGTMSGIMLAKNKSVDLLTVLKIAGGLDMTVSEFLDDPLLFDEDNIKAG
jgi:transcriptional regulator with XRE-family HTH domain